MPEKFQQRFHFAVKLFNQDLNNRNKNTKCTFIKTNFKVNYQDGFPNTALKYFGNSNMKFSGKIEKGWEGEKIVKLRSCNKA